MLALLHHLPITTARGQSMVRGLALTSVVLAFLTRCGKGSPEDPASPAAANPTTSAASNADEPGGIVASGPLTDIDPALRDAASQANFVTYASRSGVDDAYTQVSGTVFVPKGAPPEGGFAIVALGHDTTGVTPDCAPSLSPNLRNAASTVLTLLNAGYVVTLSDYQGLGHPADDENLYHPYLDSTTAGYNIIDGVRAARNVVPETSAWWAAIGTGEGGQAVWAANELADNYGYDLKRVGTASISPMADIEGLGDSATSNSTTTGAAWLSSTGMSCSAARTARPPTALRWLRRSLRTTCGPPTTPHWPGCAGTCRRPTCRKDRRRLRCW